MLHPTRAEDTPAATLPAPAMVRQFRQVLLWPLRLMPPDDADTHARPPWHLLREAGEATPWREQSDEFTGDAAHFHERHYNEFVSFLPYVQRFLYGQGRASRADVDRASDSPMRIFRRHDIAGVRVQARPGDPLVELQVVHVDLYFFAGVDIVILNVELAGGEMALPLLQEILYRSGRAYPAGWYADGRAQHSLNRCEWFGHDGTVLAASDSSDRDAFLQHVAEHRAPRIAAHWEFVLAPLVNHHSAKDGALRFRQIEYYRMPMMAWIAVNDPRRLTRNDFVRLGLVTGAGDAGASPDPKLPYAEQHLADFEQRYCYDRFWTDGGVSPNTRYLCSGLSLVVVGDASSSFYGCRDRGVLAQFRHQHFLLFLIAHFQKATLLMGSDQLAEALVALDPSRPATVKRFKRRIRRHYVDFLAFTHRYWFHEVSEQAHLRALFHLCRHHLDTEALYAEVKERIHDMSGFLDADALRRQANTVVRLTVVTIFGLIGTVTTGFLGMNLLAEAEASWPRKLWLFALVFVPTIVLTFYTMAKSKRLSDFLDAVSDERLPVGAKLRALGEVWRRGAD